MALLIGPCLLVAPVVAVVAVLAIPLWPVAIVVLGAAWLVTWPTERAMRALGLVDRARASAALARWFGVALRPWNMFDAPKPPTS